MKFVLLLNIFVAILTAVNYCKAGEVCSCTCKCPSVKSSVTTCTETKGDESKPYHQQPQPHQSQQPQHQQQKPVEQSCEEEEIVKPSSCEEESCKQVTTKKPPCHITKKKGKPNLTTEPSKGKPNLTTEPSKEPQSARPCLLFGHALPFSICKKECFVIQGIIGNCPSGFKCCKLA